MRRMAVINQKGGVGKTTTTANLGAALGRSGSRVLLIDLDPQGHLSLHFGSELAPDQPSVYDVLADSLPVREAFVRAGDNVTLLPADIDLAGAEAELSSVTGREVLLREALESVEDDFDYLLIDCPPSLGVLTVNALVAADEVLIPLQAHFLALQGLSRLLGRTVTLVRQRINPKLRVEGVVLCMHESATRLAGEVVDDLTTFLKAARGTNVAWADAKLYETCIRRNIKLAESSSFGQTVFDYAPRSNGAIDYARLAREIFDLPTVSESVAPQAVPVVSAPPEEAAPRLEVEPVLARASVVRVGPPAVERLNAPVEVEEPRASVDERPAAEPQTCPVVVPPERDETTSIEPPRDSVDTVARAPSAKTLGVADEPRVPEPQASPPLVPPARGETKPIEAAPAPPALAFITLGSGAPTPVQVAVPVEPEVRAPVYAPRAPVPPADSPNVVHRCSPPVPIERLPADASHTDHTEPIVLSDRMPARTPDPDNTADHSSASGDESQRQPSPTAGPVATAL